MSLNSRPVSAKWDPVLGKEEEGRGRENIYAPNICSLEVVPVTQWKNKNFSRINDNRASREDAQILGKRGFSLTPQTLVGYIKVQVYKHFLKKAAIGLIGHFCCGKMLHSYMGKICVGRGERRRRVTPGGPLLLWVPAMFQLRSIHPPPAKDRVPLRFCLLDVPLCPIEWWPCTVHPITISYLWLWLKFCPTISPFPPPVTAFTCVISASLHMTADNIKLHPLFSNKGASLHACSLPQFLCGKPQVGIAAEPDEAHLLWTSKLRSQLGP